jgi:hypothetical protein
LPGIIVVGVLVMGVVEVVVAQKSDCEQTLASATEEFNAGRFYGIAAMLKPCLDGGFSREQRQRANLLLTQVYLLLDDPIGAESSYLSVLRANPEFVSDPARDPIDVVYLSKKFTADPVFSVFLKMGGNTSPVRVIHSINPTGSTDISTGYTLKIGWQIGGGVDWNLSKELAVTAELSYRSVAYGRDQIKFSNDTEAFTERQYWFAIPVSVKYSDTKGVIRPYGYAGIKFLGLTGASGQIELLKQDIIGEQTTAIPDESPTLSFTKYRNAFNQAFFLGGGIRYKIGLDFVFADLRYGFGLRNVVSSTTTYGSDSPMTERGHVDDYFRMDNLSFSVGYVKPLYQPRKLKRARTKSILRSINKSAE